MPTADDSGPIKSALASAATAASSAQGLVDTADSQAELARAQAIYSESSAAQASAGQSQFAQALSKAVQEEALRKAQALADAQIGRASCRERG